MTFKPNIELMKDDEILQLTRLFACLGFDKIRLTGGEPTLRANIVELVDSISHIPGIQTVSMTTNGILLSNLAGPMANAGLQRVNISIDTLNPIKFKRLTSSGNVEEVWEGILAAERVGLQLIKLNVVVVRRYNEADLFDLARLTISHAWQVRFIEMMPFARVTVFQTEQLVTATETQGRIEQALGSLVTKQHLTKSSTERHVYSTFPAHKEPSVSYILLPLHFAAPATGPASLLTASCACACCVNTKWTCYPPCGMAPQRTNSGKWCWKLSITNLGGRGWPKAKSRLTVF